jgi:hypothetical protein
MDGWLKSFYGQKNLQSHCQGQSGKYMDIVWCSTFTPATHQGNDMCELRLRTEGAGINLMIEWEPSDRILVIVYVNFESVWKKVFCYKWSTIGHMAYLNLR